MYMYAANVGVVGNMRIKFIISTLRTNYQVPFPDRCFVFSEQKNYNLWTNVHSGQLSPVSDYLLIAGRTCSTNINWLPAMLTVQDWRDGIADGPLIQRSLYVCRVNPSWGASSDNFLLSWKRSPLWCPPKGQEIWHCLYLIFLSMSSKVSGKYLKFTERRVQFIHSFSNLSDDRSKASSKTMPPHSAI